MGWVLGEKNKYFEIACNPLIWITKQIGEQDALAWIETVEEDVCNQGLKWIRT